MTEIFSNVSMERPVLANTRHRHEDTKYNIWKIVPLVVEELMHGDFAFEYNN